MWLFFEEGQLMHESLVRNGGHITPALYTEYPDLLDKYGRKTARQMIRFRLSHLHELLAVAKEEDVLKESQCRQVQMCDVYFDRERWAKALESLEFYRKEMGPDDGIFEVWEGKEAIDASCYSGSGKGVSLN
jgi:hypothetical protein